MMKKPCQFCKIKNKEVPGYFIYEDTFCLAFLDIHPVFLGHVLLIPKPHVETFYDLPQENLTDFFSAAKLIGRAIEKSMGAEGTFLAMNNVVSQSVPHLHMHIIPRKKKDGLVGFFWPRQKNVTEEMLKEVQAKIIHALI